MTTTTEPIPFATPKLLFARQHYVLDLLELVGAHSRFEAVVRAIAEDPSVLPASPRTDRGLTATEYFAGQGVEVPPEVEIYVNHLDVDDPVGFPCINICVHGPHGEEYVMHYDVTGYHPGHC